jgi:hypothetical protein
LLNAAQASKLRKRVNGTVLGHSRPTIEIQRATHESPTR